MAAAALTLAVLVWSRSGGSGDGSDGDAADDHGVTTVQIELRSGFTDPDDGSSTVGQRVDVPDGSGVLVVAAPPGQRYALRADDGSGSAEWITLEHGLDEGPDLTVAEGDDLGVAHGEGSGTGRLALPPVVVDPSWQRIELVRLGPGGQGPGEGRSGGGDELLVAFLPADDGRPADGEPGPVPLVAGRQQAATGGVAAALATTGAPPIMARSSWTDRGWAADNAGCGDGPWYSDNVQAIVIHHTVSGNSYRADQVDDLLRAILYSHVDVNGWCDVGYNFLVDRFGTIWEARAGGVDRPVIGGHAKGFNTSTVGVALLGQHQRGARPAPASPSSASQQAITDLATWKLVRHGVDPHGTTWLKNRSTSGPQKLTSEIWHLVPTVLAHRDVGLTSCPGDLTLGLVNGLGQQVASSTPTALPYYREAWVAHEYGPGFVQVSAGGAVSVAGAATVPGMGAPPGGAPAVPPSSEAVAVAAATATGAEPAVAGHVLHRDGTLRPFGSAPTVEGRPAGDRPVVDVALAGEGGGWVLTADGAAVGFGGRPDLPVADAGFVAAIIRADLNPAGNGYAVDATGRLRPVGSAPHRQIESGVVNAVDVAVRAGGDSGWVLARDGRLHPFGGAPRVEVTSPGGLLPGHTAKAVVAAANGAGGWVLTTDGHLWPFGRQRLVFPLATSAATVDVVDVASVGPVLPASYLDGPTGRYLDHIGRLFLGRQPAPAELEYWDGLMNFEDGRYTVTLDLARSPAWAGVRIDAMYADVLGRQPDPEGSAYWLGQVREGLRLDDLGIYFYGSAEYVAAAGSNDAYVERLYQQLLGRPSDPDGRSHWVDQLDSGRVGPEAVAAGFWASPESKGKRVRDLYLSILGRPPDQAGQDFWVQRLGRIDDVELAAELAASQELYARSQQRG
jgi:hypothetical protein